MKRLLVMLVMIAACAHEGRARAGEDGFDDASPPQPSADAPFTAAPDADLQQRGRAALHAFFAPNLDGFMALLAAPNGPGRQARIQAVRDKLEARNGLAHEVIAEHGGERDGRPVYVATLRSTQTGEAYEFIAAFGPRGRVVRFRLTIARKIAADSPYLAYRTKARLRLPFDGRWHVIWGGRTLEQNYHAAFANQRFAYDFNVLSGSANHRGDAHANGSYFDFGKPVLAPASGRVVEAVDGIADNLPPERNSKQPTGNHVVIDLGQGEYALLAHLQRGSVQVAPGQRVSRGEVIGRCGNSGNSTQPHLHFELMNSPDFDHTQSLPAQFEDYVADGQRIARDEPVRGQIVWMP